MNAEGLTETMVHAAVVEVYEALQSTAAPPRTASSTRAAADSDMRPIPSATACSSADEFVQSLRREVEGLNDVSAARRERALVRLAAACFRSGLRIGAVDASQLPEWGPAAADAAGGGEGEGRRGLDAETRAAVRAATARVGRMLLAPVREAEAEAEVEVEGEGVEGEGVEGEGVDEAEGVEGFGGGGDSDDEGDEERALRRAREAELDGRVERGTWEEREDVMQVVEESFLGAFLRPVLRRVSDPSARVREGALEVTSLFLRFACRDLGACLAFVLPALLVEALRKWGYDAEEHVVVSDADAHQAHRRGRVLAARAAEAEAAEAGGGAEEEDTDSARWSRVLLADDAEPVRLALCEALDHLWQCARRTGALSLLLPHARALLLAAQGLARDPAPAIRVRGCQLVARCVGDAPDVLAPLCPGVVKALALTGLRHRLARVRVATLEAVDALVACPDRLKRKGAGSDAIAFLVAFREENVIPIRAFYGHDLSVNFFAGLAQDASARVRAAFLRVLTHWMTSLPDRADHESRLLPYVLSALADAAPAVAARARAALDALGRRLEAERQDELIERIQHGVDGDDRVDYAAPYPAPWGGARPRLGTRLLVRGSVRRFLRPVLDELSDWRGAARPRAALLLASMLACLEENATEEAPRLVLALLRLVAEYRGAEPLVAPARRTSAGPDADAAAQGLQALLHCLGRFVDPDVFVPLLLPYVRGELSLPMPREKPGGGAADDHVASCAMALRVLACALAHSRADRVAAQTPALLRALVDVHGTLARPCAAPRPWALAPSAPLGGGIGAEEPGAEDALRRLEAGLLRADASSGQVRSRAIQLVHLLLRRAPRSVGATLRLRDAPHDAPGPRMVRCLLAIRGQALTDLALQPHDDVADAAAAAPVSLFQATSDTLRDLVAASDWVPPALAAWTAANAPRVVADAVNAFPLSMHFRPLCAPVALLAALFDLGPHAAPRPLGDAGSMLVDLGLNVLHAALHDSHDALEDHEEHEEQEEEGGAEAAAEERRETKAAASAAAPALPWRGGRFRTPDKAAVAVDSVCLVLRDAAVGDVEMAVAVATEMLQADGWTRTNAAIASTGVHLALALFDAERGVLGCGNRASFEWRQVRPAVRAAVAAARAWISSPERDTWTRRSRVALAALLDGLAAVAGRCDPALEHMDEIQELVSNWLGVARGDEKLTATLLGAASEVSRARKYHRSGSVADDEAELARYSAWITHCLSLLGAAATLPETSEARRAAAAVAWEAAVSRPDVVLRLLPPPTSAADRALFADLADHCDTLLRLRPC